MMLHSPGIVLATISILLPGLRSQCVDCTFLFGGKCDTNETGYFCEQGATLKKDFLNPSDFATSTPDPNDMYSSCVPYPYHLVTLDKHCCFWSKTVGCALTLHPTLFQYGNPERHCKKCRTKCNCNRRSAALKTVTWFTLCCFLSILVIML
ncbi:hypothetical protein ACLKA6_006861 [Drosophila palustris]